MKIRLNLRLEREFFAVHDADGFAMDQAGEDLLAPSRWATRTTSEREPSTRKEIGRCGCHNG